jgi:hypothetical protein
MEEHMKFEKAKIALRDAALKIGAELFADEALLQISKIQADAGVEGAQKELDLANFVTSLFGIESQKKEKNNEFWEMIEAIAVLNQYEKDHNNGVESDA